MAGLNREWMERACETIPGGVNSPVRAYASVGGTPRFIRQASGCQVTDVDGRSYVDLVCSWGPALLGHAHPGVVAAVQEAAALGLSFGAPRALRWSLPSGSAPGCPRRSTCGWSPPVPRPP